MTEKIINKKRMLQEDDSDLKEPFARNIKGKHGNKSVMEEGTSVAQRHIRIRTSPKPLSSAMRSLSDSQRECLENLGFAPLVRFRLDAIPWKLGYFVVDCFDEQKMEMKLKRGVIKVTKNSVFEMLGVTRGGKPIESFPVPKEEDAIVVNWRKQFEKKEMTSNELMNKIVLSKEADWNFILNFLILFVNTMGQSLTRGKCDLSILRYFRKGIDVRTIDWCDYIFACLKSCKKGWRKDDENSFFAGPITLLTLLYVDNTICKGVEVERSRPVLMHWTTELLKQREAAGRFWEAKIAIEYIPPSEEHTTNHHDELKGKESANVPEAEPCNVQGCITRMETLLDSMIAKKDELLKTSKDALSKFPNSTMLEDWDDSITMLDDVLRYMHENLKGKENDCIDGLLKLGDEVTER